MNVSSDIKTNLGEVVWGCMYLIHIIQDRDQRRAFVNTVMDLWVPL
jgi:hypothetical protein